MLYTSVEIIRKINRTIILNVSWYVMNKREQAAKDYSGEMKYKDISSKYGIPINTLKVWRRQRGSSTTKKLHPKIKRGVPKVVGKCWCKGPT